MSYNADDHFPEVDRVFAPGYYTPEQRAFIAAHAGENPMVAANELTPEGLNIHRHQFRDIWGGKNNRDIVDSADDQYQVAFANARAQVVAALRRFYDLQDQQENGIVQWCGPEGVREAIEAYDEREAVFLKQKHANPGKIGVHPEMYVYDQRGGRKYQYAGSDVGRPRRYDLELFSVGSLNTGDWTQQLKTKKRPEQAAAEAFEEAIPGELRKGDDWVGCPVCSYQSQHDPESHESYGRSVIRVKQHMRAIKKDEEAHQLALAKLVE